MNRPTTEAVAEDVGAALQGMSIDGLNQIRDELAAEIKDLQARKGAIEQELWRRAKEARPEVELRGTASLAGEFVEVVVGADRTWEWNEKELLALQLAKDPSDRPLLTEVEYGRLVSWVAKVDGRYYNTLLRRGGFVAEALERCRTLKSARPTIESKVRE